MKITYVDIVEMIYDYGSAEVCRFPLFGEALDDDRETSNRTDMSID